MPITENELTHLIQSAFPQAQISCRDLAGDNDHWEVTVKDASFKGKPRIAQHRMVQAAVKDHDIHALSIKTQSE
jgi:stress-induced morphogen